MIGDTWLTDELQAKDAAAGDEVVALDGALDSSAPIVPVRAPITEIRSAVMQTYSLTTKSGHSVSAPATAQFFMPDGRLLSLRALRKTPGAQVAVEGAGGWSWSEVAKIAPLGEDEVKIVRAGDRAIAAGDEEDRRIAMRFAAE